MIPQCVKLRGFLCYKEEQCIDFAGSATLWMLSGLNGSGKSAIFDAVTYALFGHHRGGATGAVELINKDSDTMLVEFEFLLDGTPHRAKRTLKRDNKGGAKGTQQLYRQSDGRWAALEGTEYKRQFDEWIDQNLGLTYETFTSSVLLLQGRAEKLLDSRPEGRREVLASIVDLGRYERLHQKADEKRKGLEGTVKALNGRLNALPAVEPLELEIARGKIAEAETERQAARAEVERWQNIETQGKLWQNVRVQLHAAQQKHRTFVEVLDQSAAIEQAYNRWRELRDVVPRLHEIVTSRAGAKQAADQLAQLAHQRERRHSHRTEREATLRKAEEARRTLQAQVDRDTVEQAEVQAKLRDLSVQVNNLDEAERCEAELRQVATELEKLSPAPSEDVAKARERVAQLEELGRLVPKLERFRKVRAGLTELASAEQTAEQTMKEAKQRGEQCKQDAESLRVEVEQATGALRQATIDATEARTLAQQARQSLEELSQLEGAKVCRACAQPLTPGHIEEETVRRGREVKEAEERARLTGKALERATTHEAGLKGRLGQAEQTVQQAREEWKEAKNALEKARASRERSQEDCATVYGELPGDIAERIAPAPVVDWATTKWPEQPDVERLRAEARGVETARKTQREAEEVLRRYEVLKDREASLGQRRTRLQAGLPLDHKKLRQDHSEFDHREKALFKAIDSGRANVRKAEQERQKLEKERDAAVRELEEVDRSIREQELKQKSEERNAAQQSKALPEGWRKAAESMGIRDLADLTNERDQLAQGNAEQRAQQLELARKNLEDLAQTVAELEEREAAFPGEARQGAEEIARQFRQAREADQRCEESLSATKQQLALLENYQTQRDELRKELLVQEGELGHYRLLTELLGRDKLQLHLVRQAERQVVEYANAVLDRLSGGNLCMRLSGEASGESSTGKALELEVFNRATGERPINVAFLSGSQKFRVAVSLALGIGQYASRQHRPIESVIIDEGFGCLDSQGRQVMIQELQNLRSQMRCILLVSHQEDFAEAFTDGYQFRLENGATRVTRFQR